ncbi:hypothetical protein CEXT_588951 [Caerostris extrusa]|uniref:Secreted protein n=1 Tax=Caerostris extrusa TaxID=172846 RepID=A0AAV4TS62_CAEEX|nr:hypothetical protein CEXT_588951 [Caerostris extrusa]
MATVTPCVHQQLVLDLWRLWLVAFVACGTCKFIEVVFHKLKRRTECFQLSPSEIHGLWVTWLFIWREMSWSATAKRRSTFAKFVSYIRIAESTFANNSERK